MYVVTSLCCAHLESELVAQVQRLAVQLLNGDHFQLVDVGQRLRVEALLHLLNGTHHVPTQVHGRHTQLAHARRDGLVTRRLLVNQPDDVTHVRREVTACLLQVRGLRYDEEEAGDADAREGDERLGAGEHFDSLAAPVLTRALLLLLAGSRRYVPTLAVLTVDEDEIPEHTNNKDSKR